MRPSSSHPLLKRLCQDVHPLTEQTLQQQHLETTTTVLLVLRRVAESERREQPHRTDGGGSYRIRLETGPSKEATRGLEVCMAHLPSQGFSQPHWERGGSHRVHALKKTRENWAIQCFAHGTMRVF